MTTFHTSFLKLRLFVRAGPGHREYGQMQGAPSSTGEGPQMGEDIYIQINNTKKIIKHIYNFYFIYLCIHLFILPVLLLLLYQNIIYDNSNITS